MEFFFSFLSRFFQVTHHGVHGGFSVQFRHSCLTYLCTAHTKISVPADQVKTPFPCFQSLTTSGAEMYVKIDFSSIMHSVAVSGEG